MKLAENVSVPLGPARVEIVTDGVSYFSNVIICGREERDPRWLKIEMAPAKPAPLPV